ncbi:hypothetical protein FS749_016628 [Ceratobasidium sp. UAMH 11750]|nr:hypothetical protein FS749_016628 [Ceratobasidium sp. UAMH 11750]
MHAPSATTHSAPLWIAIAISCYDRSVEHSTCLSWKPDDRRDASAHTKFPSVPIDTNGVPLRYNDPRRWTDNGRTCRRPKVERFPAGTAGSPISDDQACPYDLEAYIKSCGNLAKPEYMEAAKLLMTTGVSFAGRTQYLQSSFFKGKTRAWPNDRKMLIDIDKLPRGPAWQAEVLTVGEGRHEREHVLYKRAVIDVIRDLIGNPAFKDVMRYAPERHWTNGA